MLQEREMRGIPGWVMLAVLVAGLGFGIWALIVAAIAGPAAAVVALAVALVVDAGAFGGLTVVNPNQARVVTLFGVYKGSIKTAGLLVGQSASPRAGGCRCACATSKAAS